MAAIPTLGGLPAGGVPPPLITSYCELFADPNNDPHKGQYAAALQSFAFLPHNPTPLDPSDLRTSISEQVPSGHKNAILLHAGDVTDVNDNGNLQAYINVACFSSLVGAPLSPWTNKFFSQVGDLMLGYSQSLKWPVPFAIRQTRPICLNWERLEPILLLIRHYCCWAPTLLAMQTLPW